MASAVVAYGFARIQFAGRNIWFACMLATLMLPVQVQIIPQYIVFSKLGWINTFLPLLLPRIGGTAFFIFMIMQFIRGIPKEMDEAAEIDGCGKGGIFFRIILPQITPALITAAIFSFYWTWEDFLTPLIYLNDPKLYTISLALRSFADPSANTDWGAIFAMSSLSLVPVFRHLRGLPALSGGGHQHHRPKGIDRSTSQSPRLLAMSHPRDEQLTRRTTHASRNAPSLRRVCRSRWTSSWRGVTCCCAHSAAAVPTAWPCAIQLTVLRVDMCAVQSVVISLPATSRLSTPLGNSAR